MNKQTGFAQKQLIIARKDLHMSPGKLAAQVAHGSMAYFANLINDGAILHDRTAYPTTDEPWQYRHPDLGRLAQEAYDKGLKIFHSRPADPDKPTGRYIECGPDLYYDVKFELDWETMTCWLNGDFTKVVCEARNRAHLLKSCVIADELGLQEGKDYFLIKDVCRTELEPEEVENGVGKTLTVVGFRPLPADVCDKISRKYQLYR